MSFESELRAHLLADSAITDLVGESIYPSIAPEGAQTTRITYTGIFGAPLTSINGYTSGVQRRGVQIDCWGLNFARASNVAQAVFERLCVPAENISFEVTDYPLLDDFEPDTKLHRRAIGVSCLYTDRPDS